MSQDNPKGSLYLVPTPIGNEEDFSLRARRVLSECDLIAAEDTREIAVWMRHFGISKRLLSYYDHNEENRIPELLSHLNEGRNIALVSDAGTPLISDPGYRMVIAAVKEGINVVSLPGPCAAIVALSASALPPDRFYFAGFLPRQEGPCKDALTELALHPSTLIFYESPHRLIDTLDRLLNTLGDRRVSIGWNLTKKNERYFYGTCSTLLAEFKSWEYMHGEITIVVAGAPREEREREQWKTADRIIDLLLSEQTEARVIRDVLGEIFTFGKREIYQRVLQAQRAKENTP